MPEHSKTWAPPRQALLLAFIQAYGWFWIHVLFTSSGSYSSGAGDLGLITLGLGWFWALMWGWVVCWPISRHMIGVPSVAGYVASAVLLLPELVLGEAVDGLSFRFFGRNSPVLMFVELFPSLFSLLGLGILPEGRAGFASVHVFIFLTMFVAGIFGFAHTINNRTNA